MFNLFNLLSEIRHSIPILNYTPYYLNFFAIFILCKIGDKMSNEIRENEIAREVERMNIVDVDVVVEKDDLAPDEVQTAVMA